MPTSLQTYFEAWRDAVLDAMTPRQRALLKSGHRVWVRIGRTKYMIVPADHPSQANVRELPISFG
jgi:hypothetical protein